jgi:hypothetical protein
MKFVKNLYDSIINKYNTAKQNISNEPVDVPSDNIQDLKSNPKQYIKDFIRSGSTFDGNNISKLVGDTLATNYYRRNFYINADSAIEHAYISGALELYTDNAVSDSSVNNKSIWVSSNDKKIENLLNKFLESIHIYERLRDWAGQIAQYGDFFVRVYGVNGIGVAYIDDNIYPADIERIDINGRLEGFIHSGYLGGSGMGYKMDAPWDYVHFRIFGIQRKMMNSALGIFGVPNSRYRVEVVNDRRYKLTTRYGVSLIQPAIPIYKRLKMGEDSIMMSRITRGVLWYLYKIQIKGGNYDSAMELVDEYQRLLKRHSALDVSEDNKYWKDNFASIFGQIEDMYIPTTEDMDVVVEKLGDNPDIKAIVDIDMLEERLLGALRVSKSMLGLTSDLPGGIGESAANRISVNFAKNVNRLQNSIKVGVKRLCQIHLAYLGINPDPRKYDIEMSEVSSAEQEELKNGLQSGVETVDKFMGMMDSAFGDNIDKTSVLKYLNEKILKLNDFNIEDMMKKEKSSEEISKTVENKIVDINENKKSIIESDLFSYLPRNKLCKLSEGLNNDILVDNIEWNKDKIKLVSIEEAEYKEKVKGCIIHG